MKKTLYIDMDNVLVDFKSGIKRLTAWEKAKFGAKDLDEVPGIFSRMDPMEGAIRSFKKLSQRFDTYVLSTAPWENPSAWSDKLLWVKRHLHVDVEKRLILSHHKNLLRGDYIIDDRTARGVDRFVGEHIHFGQGQFRDWDAVMRYLAGENNPKRNRSPRSQRVVKRRAAPRKKIGAKK